MKPRKSLGTETVEAFESVKDIHPSLEDAFQRLSKYQDQIEEHAYFEIFWLIFRTALQRPEIMRDKRSAKLKEVADNCCNHIKISHRYHKKVNRGGSK